MKKGLLFVILSLMTFSIGMTVADVLCPIDGGTTPYECVCGHTPDSTIGYGQIIIGGSTPTIISCSNDDDGICPEDFQDPDTGIVGNCSRCIDPDCTVGDLSGEGYVWGYVRDIYGRPIEKAIVSGNPTTWNNSNINMDKSTQTDAGGKYNYTGFASGTYYFSAAKDAYDTELLQAQLIRGEITRIDFTLLNGTCHEDCTNSHNRCNKACDGVTFNDSNTICSFYDNSAYSSGKSIKELCNNVPIGRSIRIMDDTRNNATHTYTVDCCEGIPYPQPTPKVKTSGNNIADLYKSEQIATCDGEPCTININSWLS